MAGNRVDKTTSDAFGVNGAYLQGPQMSDAMRQVYAESSEKHAWSFWAETVKVRRISLICASILMFICGFLVANINLISEKITELPLWLALSVMLGAPLIGLVISILNNGKQKDSEDF